MSDGVLEAMGVTRSFLFENLYLGKIGAATREAVARITQTLLEHYAATPPPAAPNGSEADDPRVRAVDYVSGMTDRFAIRAFEALVESPAGLHALG